MESLITSNIRIKGGEVAEHPGVSLSGHIVSGHENIHKVKSSFTELAQFEAQDFSFYIAFEANDEEASIRTEETFAKMIQRWTSDDDSAYSLRKIRKVIARSEDEETSDPKFFPKLYRNGKKIILQLALIKEFRDQLQSEIDKLIEINPNQFESNQEVNFSLKTTKNFNQIKESEESLTDVFGSINLEITSALNRLFVANLSKYLSKINTELHFYVGAFAIASRLNIDINYEDFLALGRRKLDRFLDDAESQNRKFRRLFRKQPRAALLRYLKVLRDNVKNQVEVFGVSPFVAVKLHLQVADLLKDLVGDWEE